MRLCCAYSRCTKVVTLSTGTTAGIRPHLPDYWVQVRKESTTIHLGEVVNENKGKGEEGSQEDERSGQRETEVQVESPEPAPQTRV